MSESASENTPTPVDAEQSNEAVARVERAAALATLAITREEERSERENDEKCERKSASVLQAQKLNVVKLRLGDVVFEVERSELLRVKNTYFYGMLSSGAWQPDADGAYYIDRSASGFDRILAYLSTGELSVEGLSDVEQDCMYSNLDFFLIPYTRQWRYAYHQVIEGFIAQHVYELNDGRLCGAFDNDIIVYNMDSAAVEMTLKGHTGTINQVIQLQDGRVCSCSDDRTIKLWSINSRVCELTLTSPTYYDKVLCMAQLLDGRLCTGYENSQVWDVSTGMCVMTLNSDGLAPHCIAQLADGRICCGEDEGCISIYSLLTGEKEVTFGRHDSCVTSMVCIDATRVCTACSEFDENIRVWNTATQECERTLEGNTYFINSLVLMHDGRLCSASEDLTIKLWNLETGECEKTLSEEELPCLEEGGFRAMQLRDGRLLVICFGSTAAPVYIVY